MIDLRADWISVMIGINDVWLQTEAPYLSNEENKTRFRETYSKLIESIINEVEGVILMTPYYIDLNKKDLMRKMMDEYGEIVKELAQEYGTLFVNVQKSFDRYLEINPFHSLCDDRIHPNSVGHMLIANSFLKTIGFEWK